MKKSFTGFWKSLTRKQRILFVTPFILLYIPVYLLVSFNYNPYEKSICLNDKSYSECFSDYLKYHVYDYTGNCYLNKFDENGLPMESHELLLDIYVIDSNLTNEQVVKAVDEANLIWKNYGARFYVNTITRMDGYDLNSVSLRKLDEIEGFANEIVKDRLYFNEDTIIDVIFVEKFPWKLKILFWNFSWNLGTAGKGLKGFDNRSVNLVLVSTRSGNVSWDLAHELGHILGNVDKAYYSGEYNLMTHSGCIRDRHYPTVLNQRQVDNVVSQARLLKHKNS